DLVVLIEQRHPSLQIRHYDCVFMRMEVAGRFRAGHDVDRFVVQRVTHDAVVASIRHQQNRVGRIAEIDHVAVRVVGGLDRHLPGYTRLSWGRERPSSSTLRLIGRWSGTLSLVPTRERRAFGLIAARTTGTFPLTAAFTLTAFRLS